MVRKEIVGKLRAILNRADIESDGLINRKRSSKHDDDIAILLEHVSLLVADLRFDAAASRKELFEVRALLENLNDE